MKKLSLIIVSLVANLAFAQSAFMGVKGGVMHDFITILNTTKPSNTHALIGINGGYDFDKYRVYSEINYHPAVEIAKQDELDEERTVKMSNVEVLFGADYYISKADKIKLFIGGFTGFESRDVEMITKYKSSHFKDKSEINSGDCVVLLGVRFGGIYAVNNNNDIEFGARLDKPFYASDETNIKKLAGFIGYTHKF